MDYSAYHQQQGYDPSAQPQQFYNQSTEDYYSYAYSNPQYVNNQPYPYHSVNVQPSQHQEQEPNPPGVTVPPPLQQDPNAYYQSLDYAAAAAAYTVGPQQGGVDAGVSVAHQPIVQSSYNDTGLINGLVPQGGAQVHLGPILQSSYNDTGTINGIVPQGGAQAHLGPILQSSYNDTGTINGIVPQGGAQTHLGPIPNFSARPYRGRGGRGRGRGRSIHKRSATPAQDQTIFSQGGSHVQVGPPQPTPQSYAPSFGPTSMPFQGQAHTAHVLPASKHLLCELCQVECNSIEILNRHKSGKKHMKKLKSLEESQNVNNMAIGGQIEQTSVFESKSEVPFQPTDQIEAFANQQLQQESLPPQDINEENRVGVEKGKVEEVKISLWCELCKVDCNSVEILNNHKNGKKHQKKLKIFEESQNLNKSQQIELSENQKLEQESLPSQDNDEENKSAVEKQQVEELETTEGVERGLKRKMRGGKVGRNTKRSKRSIEPLKPKEVIPLVCELCNIKCESQVVFQSHIVGKKHLLNAKRFLSQNETLGQEVFQILQHAIQTLHELNANASTSSIVASQLNQQGLLLAQSMDFQASTLETNLESARVEDISQPQLLPANFGGPIMANAEGISNEGRSESDFATGRLVSSAKMEIVATDGKAVTSEII